MIKQLCGFHVDISYKQNMKTIKFRFVDGIMKISCPKISDKEIIKFIERNLVEFTKKIEESKLSNNFTYYQGSKYEIISTNEIYNSVIINETTLTITKGKEEVLLKEMFIKDLEYYIKSKELEMKLRFPNIEYPKIKIKKLKSSFGQYNKKTHTITLDYKLAKYDRIYLYLTLAHEFCHIIHFDHSLDFYKLLDTFVPNSKQMHKIMRKIKMNDIF